MTYSGDSTVGTRRSIPALCAILLKLSFDRPRDKVGSLFLSPLYSTLIADNLCDTVKSKILEINAMLIPELVSNRWSQCREEMVRKTTEIVPKH